MLLTPTLESRMAIPQDKGLPDLANLFDPSWLWNAYKSHVGMDDAEADRLRIKQFSYRPGERAIVSYVAEREWGQVITEDEFSVEMKPGVAPLLFRYPNDPYLPGLAVAGDAIEASKAVFEHTSIAARRLKVEPVRYRPGHRAVLRHEVSWRRPHTSSLTLFARVMPPSHLSRYMHALSLAKGSGFCVPDPVGIWAEGGVLWTPEVQGETVRSSIKVGCPPSAESLMDGLSKLWDTSIPTEHMGGTPLDVLGGYTMSRNLLEHVAQNDTVRTRLEAIADVLGPFAAAWRPSCLAHNDFHDDQLIVTPDGQLALIDFEEVGPGDPLLDVGTILAHLHWMARFSATPDAFQAYREQVRSAALSNFGWSPEDLDIREAFALFRLSSGPTRQLKGKWAEQVDSALVMVGQLLGQE